jgi:hypothetical protein
MMKMMFSMKLDYNKVVVNLLVLNFHGNRPNGL